MSRIEVMKAQVSLLEETGAGRVCAELVIDQGDLKPEETRRDHKPQVGPVPFIIIHHIPPRSCMAEKKELLLIPTPSMSVTQSRGQHTVETRER